MIVVLVPSRLPHADYVRGGPFVELSVLRCFVLI